MILFLDTSDLHHMILALIPKSGDITRHEFAVAYNENDQTLGFLDKFLKRHRVKADDINKIIVCSGPGSFTGTRVGVTIAQAFGFAKNIPVVAIKKTQVPTDLRKLATLKASGKLILHYNRPAVV